MKCASASKKSKHNFPSSKTWKDIRLPPPSPSPDTAHKPVLSGIQYCSDIYKSWDTFINKFSSKISFPNTYEEGIVPICVSVFLFPEYTILNSTYYSAVPGRSRKKRRCLNQSVLSECSMQLLVCWTQHLWPYPLPFPDQPWSDQSRYWPADSKGMENAPCWSAYRIEDCIQLMTLFGENWCRSCQGGLRFPFPSKHPQFFFLFFFASKHFYTLNTCGFCFVSFYREVKLTCASSGPSLSGYTISRYWRLLLTLKQLFGSDSGQRAETVRILYLRLRSAPDWLGPLEHLPALSSVHSHHGVYNNIATQCALQHRSPVPVQLGNNYPAPTLYHTNSIRIDSRIKAIQVHG